MNGKLQEINISDIKITNKNPRNKEHKTNGSLKKLVESIKQFGVRVPIHVRPAGGPNAEPITFELCAGERRVYACKAAGLKTIPAIVQTQDEATAFETTMAENEARLDLTLAEEITKVETLVCIHKGDIKAVASRMNISEQQVRLRCNAAKKLSKKWRKDLNSGSERTLLSVEHIDLIARLPENIQNDILNYPRALVSWNGSVTSIKKLDRWINTTYTHALDKAPWDADIVCSKCPKQSDKQGQAELWDIETTEKRIALCLDAACWQRHVLAVLKKRIADIKKEHDVVRYLVSTDNYHSNKMLCDALKIDAQTVNLHGLKRVSKSTKGAKPAIILDGPQAGKTAWTLSPRQASGKQKKVRVKTIAERRKNLEGLRLKLLYIKLREAVEQCDEPTDTSLKFTAAVAAVYGTEASYRVLGEGTADQDVKSLQIGKTVPFGLPWDKNKQWSVDLAGALWLLARKNFASKIPFNPNATDALKAKADCQAVAKLVKFDWNKAWKEACEQKKEPKSWDKLKADGTPK